MVDLYHNTRYLMMLKTPMIFKSLIRKTQRETNNHNLLYAPNIYGTTRVRQFIKHFTTVSLQPSWSVCEFLQIFTQCKILHLNQFLCFKLCPSGSSLKMKMPSISMRQLHCDSGTSNPIFLAHYSLFI